MADQVVTDFDVVTTLDAGDYLQVVTDPLGTPEWVNITFTNLVAAIGGLSTFQPLDATLTALAGLTIAANTITIGTGPDAFAQTAFAANTFPARASTGALVAKPVSDFGLSLIDDAAAVNARSTLGVVIGTDVLAYDAGLDALAAVVTAADKLIYATGADAFATTDLTAFARTLLDDANAAAMRTTLGLGTMATAAAADYLPLAGETMTGPLLSSSYLQGTYIRTNAVNSYDNGFSFLTINSGTGEVLAYGNGAAVLYLQSAKIQQRNGATSQVFESYHSYTDASNYQGVRLSQSASAVTLAAITAGTGADDIDVVLTPAGTGAVKVANAATQKIGLYGVAPVVQAAAMTASLTAITFTAPGTPDYALQDVTNIAPYGFADAEEARTLISVVSRLQTQVAELKAIIANVGLSA